MKDAAVLENRFRWSFESGQQMGDIPAVSLLEPTSRKQLLDQWRERIGTQEWSVAASMLAKRYTAMIMPGWLFTLSRLNRVIPVTPQRWLFRFGDGWDVRLILPADTQTNAPVSSRERESWRQQATAAFFCNHLSPFFHALSDHLSPSVSWESALSYLYYYYESWEREAETEEERKRLREDFLFLTQRNNPWIDGRTPNPLSIPFRLISPPEDEGEPLRLRRTCCLYYRLPEAGCCSNCPRRRHDLEPSHATRTLAEKKG
ncbi:(2Fe-2S)-binding protein [Desmospora profundinema]|uniref:Ferric iron reductase protein FhuF n=1 Tax=Desmospora profundinema TaxID=1571184 RepID=A0ABU1IPC8_9BACL|nr:(2Fe-2S)-binding protein [Desmospora profundinema]MDR6225809.1 ferric iron reductase protein FhuF [Desmospora profundinema]